MLLDAQVCLYHRGNVWSRVDNVQLLYIHLIRPVGSETSRYVDVSIIRHVGHERVSVCLAPKRGQNLNSTGFLQYQFDIVLNC
jgi:hypothetical protein